MRVIFLATIAVLSMLLLTAPCLAAPLGTCSVSPAGSISFGNYDVFSTRPLDSTGAIQITCDMTQPHLIVSIGPSQNGSGFNPRYMKTSSGGLLGYNLFTDAARTAIWGDGTGGTRTIMQKVLKNTPLNVTIYGRIPASQDVGVGRYSDSLIVTITW